MKLREKDEKNRHKLTGTPRKEIKIRKRNMNGAKSMAKNIGKNEKTRNEPLKVVIKRKKTKKIRKKCVKKKLETIWKEIKSKKKKVL